MSLNLDWRDCAPDSPVCKSPFEYGCLLMAVGMSEVNEKRLAELELRIGVYNSMVPQGAWTVQPRDLVGLKANVSNEPFSRWVGRIYKRWKVENRVR